MNDGPTNDQINLPGAAALRRRYRTDMAPPPEWNGVLDTLLAHRSTRAFLPDAVSDATLATLVAAASSASTSSNLQTWSVLAVRDPERKARLATLAANQRFIDEAPLFLVFLADLSRLSAIADARGAEVVGPDYLEMLIVAAVDAALAAQNLVTAAESLSLGTCYIGSLRNRPEDVAAELNLPPRVFGLFGMCIGHPDPARASDIKPRLPKSTILHHEQYAYDQSTADLDAYDARMSAFQSEQGMPPEVWTQRCINRVRTQASLTGRHRMREALGAMGFRLL